MIILDTHIWIWHTHGDSRLTERQEEAIQAHEDNVVGVSVFSCWEIAKLVELNRLDLHLSLEEWFDEALHYPGVHLLELTPQIAIESTQLPGEFHRDPADQIITATARIHGCPLVTSDGKIVEYAHVGTIA